MRTPILLVLCAATALLCPSFLIGQELATPPEISETAIVENEYPTVNLAEVNDTAFGDAVRINQIATSTTGMAISPLLGMGVLGAWKYVTAETAEARAALPWFANPWVWGIAFSVFALAKWKDTFGFAVPEPLKKPLQAVDIFEDKVSAFIVMLAVIPVNIASNLPQAGGDGGGAIPSAAAGGDGGANLVMMAGVGLPGVITPWLIAIPFAIGAFVVVWTVSHGVKCLLILSPSIWVTGLVKFAKAMLLAFLVLLSSLSPWAGIGLSILLVLLCIPIFAYAYRWNVFGTIFVWDYLFSRNCIPLRKGEELTGFVTRRFGDVKPLTYGSIRRAGGELAFRYRPWLVFPPREVRMTVGELGVAVRRGFLMPGIVVRRPDGADETSVIDLRPRFRKHEEEIAPLLLADEVIDSRLVTEFKAAWRWFADQFTGGPAPRAVPVLAAAGGRPQRSIPMR